MATEVTSILPSVLVPAAVNKIESLLDLYRLPFTYAWYVVAFGEVDASTDWWRRGQRSETSKGRLCLTTYSMMETGR